MKLIYTVVLLSLVGCANQYQGQVAGAAIGAIVGSVVGKELSTHPHQQSTHPHQQNHRSYDPYRICNRYLNRSYPDKHAYNHCVQDIRHRQGR